MSPIGIAPTPMPAARPAIARRSAVLALAGIAVLGAAACSAPTASISTRSGYSIVGDDIPVSVCPSEGESRLSDEEGTLISAHFALRVECVASFTEIPEDFQLAYLFGDDAEVLPPEAGFEFTLVQFAPEPDAEAPDEDANEVTGTLAIGDVTWDFDQELPGPGSVYLAVTEADSPVNLELTDAERTQSLDLRERTRTGTIEALYTGEPEVKSDVIEHTVEASLNSGGYNYWVDGWVYSTNFVGTRTVYADGEWVAEPDRALLSVSFVWMRSGSGLEWDIDPEETLKVSGPDGALEPAVVDHDDEDYGDGELRYYDMQYDVPADALEFTLKFSPKGPIAWPEEGIEMPVENEKTHEAALDFA
ncbi:hypothetical protein [Glycomyces buryatensis]|uniref:Uncharacterized protein n=1 Tax=Glycomyces buryatensis TaxID=2570927 RepID=A0A4S8QKI9_9ACTN|nr:hypothetical protein [Glycomyces buryatensis]THV43515.1 hypothetical protein FAB82_00160 [Glycomyces buryatensis]